MIDGNVRKVNWKQYEAPNFRISLKHKNEHFNSCTAAALSMITGIKPDNIDHWKRDKTQWSGVTTRRWLANRGYTTVTVTRNSIANVEEFDYHWQDCPLNDNHVLLVCCMMDIKENSIVVVHKGKIWHNFEKTWPPSPLFFLNKPTWDVYIVFNKKWKQSY